jgi:hypothetical protein
MDDNRRNRLLMSLVELLELPDGVYEKAITRYEDIGEWLCRDSSLCKENDPHVFSQGSFRLGTAIHPLGAEEEYDLDLVCKLQTGVTKSSHTQKSLKTLVGKEIQAYIVARGIKAPIEEKHRCWRINYADDLSFHIDIVPCIPEEEARKNIIFESVKLAGENEEIAQSVSDLTVSITDDRHSKYEVLCNDWLISNPEGYAKWFETRMYLNQRIIMEKAQTDDIPAYKRKTPLQRAVQLLKRHRDQMFKDDPDVKPISIIITTLAARAYKGEPDIRTALHTILVYMREFINSGSSTVINPVNPNENFADRWTMPQYNHLNLRRNFVFWVTQVCSDFDLININEDIGLIAEQISKKFSVQMNADNLRKQLGIALPSSLKEVPKVHVINNPPKPWCR